MLVRFNDDHDVTMALRNALRDASVYRSLAGYEATGAITIAVFMVADEREAQVLTAGIGQSLYGLATVGGPRDRGYDVVATDVEEEGVLLPFSGRHADVIVSAYPEDLPPYDERLRASQRKPHSSAAPRPIQQGAPPVRPAPRGAGGVPSRQ